MDASMNIRFTGLLAATAVLATGCADHASTGAGPGGPPSPRASTSSAPSTTGSPQSSARATNPSDAARRIELTVGDTNLTATLNDTAASDDLLGQLPLTITMRDFGSVEKIGRLPAPLSTTGVPTGADPAVGDLGYYAPWNNLVIYYGDQGYHDGIIRLATLNGDITAVGRLNGDLTAHVERVLTDASD
jgi:hypothetical protein